MAKGRVSVVLAADAVARVNAHIDGIVAELPFLVALSEDERKGIVKLGPKSVDFVDKTRRVAGDHPGLVPADLDGPEFIKDADLYTQLGKFSGRLMEVAEAVADTRMQAGSEAMVVSLILYGILNQAKKVVPGLDDVMGEMGKRFKHAGKEQKGGGEKPKPAPEPPK